MRIAVTRAFYLAGEPQAVGAVVDVPDALGIELVALGKAVRSDAAPAEPVAAPSARRRKPAGE